MVEDIAPSKWTRQSTAAGAQSAAFAQATEPESSPWWEIDFGKNFAIEALNVWIAPVDASTRIRICAFTVPNREADPPVGCFARELAAGDLQATSDGSRIASLPDDFVARYVRISLVAGTSPVSLELRGIQIFGAPLFADSLAETYRRAFTLFAEKPLFSARSSAGEGEFRITHHYRDAWTAARKAAQALARRLDPADAQGTNERIFLGLCTKNRAEWFIAETAAVERGYVVVPLSPDDSEDRLRAILSRCPARAIVCESSIAEALARIAEDHPALRLLVIVGDPNIKKLGSTVAISFDDLLREGVAGPPAPPPEPRSPDDLHTLLFTSGSTGVPKGAMRSYRKFNAMIASYGVAQPAFHLSFQPLSHLSERHYLPAVIMNGALVGFSSGGAHLLSDLAAFEPTWVSSVPRLFDVVYAGYQRKLAAALAAEPERDPAAIEASVLRAHRSIFGGRIQGVSTGSAPVSPDVLAFLRRCFADLWVGDGYGSTEVGTVSADNKILPTVEVKLVPISDGEEAGDASGGPERGEIWVRSPHVIDGYFGDPEASAKSLDNNGFFRTGDLGERTADGGVRVIGRLSSAIKLGQGEFVSVDRIEADLSSCSVVDRIFIHPDSSSSSLLAVVIPNTAEVARELGDPSLNLSEVVAHPKAADIVVEALRSYGRSKGLAGHEIPRAVLLDPEPMTVESGLLTSSGKLVRRAAVDRYRAGLAALEASAKASAERAVGASAPSELGARLAQVAGSIIHRAVKPEERLSDGIGKDSLTASEVLSAISDELGWTVPLAWWFEAKTLADLAAMIERKPSSTAGDDDRPARDLELSLSIDPSAEPPRTAIERVLLTGATGLLGAHLLEEIIERTGAHVVCLVRAPDNAAAVQRVRRALASFRIPSLDPARWSALAGDLASPRLGLSEATCSALAGDIDAIIHSGATVNWLSVYEDLRGPNVLGTLSLLELGSARRRKHFHSISTISTAPPDGDESTSLSFAQARLGSAYGLTKWIAEQHVRRAGQGGLPVTIYRPGLIIGHSKRGYGNPDDYVHRYLRACVAYGHYLDRPERVDMTPADYVSRAVVALAFEALGERGGVYHLCNVEQSMSYADLGAAIASTGVPCSPTDYSTFRAVAVKPRESPLRPLASYFPESGFGLGSGPWPCSATRARLESLSVRCPPIDRELIAKTLAALKSRASA